MTQQLLRLSSKNGGSANHSNKTSRLSHQVTSLLTILDAFGSCKTPSNSSASQHGRYLELYFHSTPPGSRRTSSEGKLTGAKVLTFGLNKSRLTHLEKDERSFHVFYQLLAGAKPDEREELDLEGPDAYALLASSGCYRLPGGPFSDDSLQFDELRIAMANLGFKAKHLKSIFSVLVTLLLLGNIRFENGPNAGSVMDEPAQVTEDTRAILEQVASRLGVSAEALEQGLVNENRWIRKEQCSSFLDTRGAAKQRDSLVKNLYAILFAFIVETANRKLAPLQSDEEDDNDLSGNTMIVQLDLPGYQSKTLAGTDNGRSSHGYEQTLVNSTGVNSVDEFASNVANEMLHSYMIRRVFDETVEGGLNSAIRADGIQVPRPLTMDNSACLEMLRGGVLQSQTSHLATRPLGLLGVLDDVGVSVDPDTTHEPVTRQDADLLATMTRVCGVHASFVANPLASTTRTPLTGGNTRRHAFGINHYAGSCNYDIAHFVEKNADIIDSQLVSLLKTSRESFVAKLVAGPSISAETHPLDRHTVVQAQVSVCPFREPALSETSTLESTRAHPLTTQMNSTMSDILSSLDRAGLWHVMCIRPNDAGHPNSIDKRRVKHQIRTMLIPDTIKSKQIEYVASQDKLDFCNAHGLRFDYEDPDSIDQAVDRFASEHAWSRPQDYAIGSNRVWFGDAAWTDVDASLRMLEGDVEELETLSPFSESPQKSSPYGMASGAASLDAESFMDASKGYGGFESRENLIMGKQPTDAWNSEQKLDTHHQHLVPTLDGGSYADEKASINEKNLSNGGNEAVDMIVHEKGHKTALESIPTTRSRRWWVRITWLFTWWIPSFLLAKVGRMKRPDIRMAWREKFTICSMIALLCGVVIFYIVGVGQLLCPDMDKAWNTSQLGENAKPSSYYSAIHGYVYDVSFVH